MGIPLPLLTAVSHILCIFTGVAFERVIDSSADQTHALAPTADISM